MSDEKSSEDRAASAPAGAAKKLICFGVGSALWIVASMAYGLHLGAPDAANTLGDFLAGVFAPAAFAMLFAAVWIQSDELREQRNELMLTRREFAYNREVMVAQADEARKQAEYIGEQTAYLREQNERSRKQKIQHDIDVWIVHLKSHATSIWSDDYERALRGRYILRKLDGFDFLKELCFRIKSGSSASPGWTNKIEGALEIWPTILGVLEHLFKLSSALDDAPQGEFATALLQPAIQALRSELSNNSGM